MTNEFEQPATWLRRFIKLTWQYKYIMLSVFVTIVVIVTIGSFVTSPVFETSSKILIEQELDSQKALLFRMDLTQNYDDYNWVNSEIEIINSYPVAARVVKALQLDQLRLEKRPISATEQAKRTDQAIKQLIKKLKIDKVRNSNVIVISYEGKDPKLVTSIVNTMMDSYIQYRLEISNKSENYNFFDEQIRITDAKLRELEQRQTEFKQHNEVLSPKEQREILLARLADYERNLTDIQTKRIGRIAKLAVIKEQLKKGQELSIPATEVSDSPSRDKYIAKLKGDLFDMKIQREQLLQKFTPGYEEVINLDKQIAATNLNIKNEILQIITMEETSIRASTAEEEVYQQSIDKIKKDIQEFAQKEYEYDQISRGIDDTKEIYSILLKQREEARISLAKSDREVKIKIISPAIVPLEPTRPRKLLNIAMAIVLGIFVGVGLVFVIDYINCIINPSLELNQLRELIGSREAKKLKNEDIKRISASKKRIKSAQQ